MTLFLGQSARGGIALAAAARLHTEFGAPTLAPERLRRLGERLRRFGVDVPDTEHIVLVADSLPPGFLLSPIPGLQIVGVATQSEDPFFPPPSCPAVAGLGDSLLAQVEEDDLVIVDGDRGRVYVAPDAATVARYQSPTRLSRRFFIESTHLPAKTASDNRVIPVLAPAPTLASVSEAMDAGADGIVIPEDNDFLGGAAVTQTAGEQLAVLTEVAQVIAGQPLFLHVPPERLALSALARAASAGPLHLVLEDLDQRDELRARLTEIESLLEEQDVLFGSVQFEAGLSAASDEAPLPETLEGFAGAFLTERMQDALGERLLLIAGLARHGGKPATVALDGDWWPQFLSDALGLGFERLIVPARAAADVKDAIRES